MARNRNNPILRRIFTSQIFLTIAGLGILILLSFPLAKNISQRHKIDKEVGKMQEEIGRIEKKNSGLKKLVNYLESDQFAESEARIKLGLKKSGEEVVGIKEQTGIAEEPSELQTVFNMPGLNNNQDEKSESNPGRWLKYFFARKNSL
ncbi:MAG: septum formation initiator family protein [Patescibacteria group bacterium]|jgi:cell division protein FtsB